MFKKIVSNLPFSPALVGQISPYIKRLKKESLIRQLGLVFLLLTIVIQIILVAQPDRATITNGATDTPPTVAGISYSIASYNITHGSKDATGVINYPNDRISYTITASNTSKNPVKLNIKKSVKDILDYAQIIDNGGGRLNATTQDLEWNDTTIAPNSKTSHTFLVQILDKVPITAVSTADRQSFDCVITNSYGNTINNTISCPPIKALESLINELPKLSYITETLVLVVIFTISLISYIDNDQLVRELELIRKDAHNGTF